MSKLGSTYIYRLNLLIGGPRFYKQNVYNSRLQQRGMIVATGRTELDTNRAEYEITEIGRNEIAKRSAAQIEWNPQ